MSNCVVKSGESVEVTDPRLSDTACIIESGAIIRPPPDLTIVEIVPPPVKKLAPVRIAPPPPPPLPAPLEVVKLPDQEPVLPPQPEATKTSTAVAPVDVDAIPMEDPGLANPVTVTIAAGAAIAVAGTAAAGAATGGFSALQAKLASIFGTTKGAVATGAVVTAGTIVAVKALENKMTKLERDLEKTKEEVGGASESISRIDALLDRLGS